MNLDQFLKKRMKEEFDLDFVQENATNGTSFDEWKDDMEFNNYASILDLVFNNVSSYLNPKDIMEIWDEWIEELES
jgi:hypothetical protein